MKTTKRFFIALLAVFSVIAGKAQVISVGEEDFAEGDIGYCFWSDTEVYVVNYAGNVLKTTKVEIPEVVTFENVDYTVIGIFDEAFQKFTRLQEVVLPATVEEIGEGAFTRCSLVEGVVHYTGLTKLTSINLENVKRIGANAFRASGFSSICLSENLEEIGANAFADCASLATVEVNTSVVATNVFSGCENLINVAFGSSVAEIATGLFANTGVSEVSLPSNLVSIGARAFLGTNIEAIEIPASVTTIGAQAFHGCADLKNVNFESSPTIGVSAFPSTASLNLTIKDKETFYNENPNTFDKITYAREFSSESYSSLILPFVPDQLDQMEVYQMAEKKDTVLVFKPVDEFVPGTPYMVRVLEGNDPISELTGTNAEIALSGNKNDIVAGDWHMIGQYERVVLKADSCYAAGFRNYYYATASNEFLYSEGKLAVSPFRAYIQAPKDEVAQVRMMIRSNDGVETEIDAAELEDVFAPAEDVYYDMNGCRVLAPVKGRMYIVNGKKMIF